MLPKTVSENASILSEVMMPVHANHYGNIHGGTILKLVDEAAFVAATKHARKNVVVASIDCMEFKHPVEVGDVLTLRASVYHVGRSSMDVEVEIVTEKIKQGKTLKVGQAYLTMVALDEKGRPAEVPPLILKTKEEKNKSAFIKRKRQERIAHFYGG